jgi:hypothetical protein
MLPFGVTIPATVPQGSEIPEGLTNNPVDFTIFVLTNFVKMNNNYWTDLYDYNYKYRVSSLMYQFI